MEPASVWTSLEVAKLLVSLLVPLLVVVVGYLLNRRLKEIEQENQRREQLRAEEQQRIRDEDERRYQQQEQMRAEEQQRVRDEEDRQYQQREKMHALEQERVRNEIERRHEPHIELTIACNFFGPQDGWYIAEFVISARNASLVQHKFETITLRVRGIKQDEPLELWEGHGERLEFRHKLLEMNIVPPKWRFIFIEPGVTQQISFITRIPEEYRYLVAWAQFSYDEYTPHNIERMFEVSQRSAS